MQHFSNINIRQHIRFFLFAFSVLIVLCLVVSVAYFGQDWPKWTGFGRIEKRIRPSDGEVIEYLPQKTLWDLLDLLIVPAILAGGAYWFQRAGKQREQYRQEQQAQETTLQGYLDKITDLLIKEPSSDPRLKGPKKVMARSRTLTALHTLNNVRRGIMLNFLYESNLITGEKPFVDLSEANFSHAFLRGRHLCGANLHQVTLRRAELSSTNLSHANLIRADLSGANLTKAILHGATLRSAELNEAQLSGARFHASKLSDEDYKKLSHECRLWVFRESFDSIVGYLSNAVDILREFDNEWVKIMYKDQESEVKSLMEQLADIDERLKVWIEEGRDLRTERILQEIKEGKPKLMLADAIKQKDKRGRKYSEESEEMKKEREELQQQLKRAEEKLETYVRVDLRDAKLTSANLQKADLRWADCRGANFQNADLRLALLMNTDFTNALLDGADLRGASITKDQLHSVKSLKGSRLGGRLKKYI